MLLSINVQAILLTNFKKTDTIKYIKKQRKKLMDRYGKLAKNTMLISVGVLTSKLIVYLMVRFYTGYLTPAEYGDADLISQTANLLFPVVSLGITDGVFRFAINRTKERDKVFSSGGAIILLGALAMLVSVPFLKPLLDDKIDVTAVFLYTAAACVHSLCSQFVRAIGNTRLFALQGILNTFLVVTLNIIFLAVLGLGIDGYVYSIIIADTLCAIYIFLREKLWRFVTVKLDARLIKNMLKYSIPLIPTGIFWWITSVSDRYMINWMVGSTANGIYTMACKLPTAIILLSGAFSDAWQYSAVSERKDGEASEYKTFFSDGWLSFQGIMFFGCSIVIALAKPGIRLLAAAEYFSAYEYVPLLCCAMVFSSFATFMGSTFLVLKRSKLSFITSMVGAVANIILNLILIPRFEIYGAAVATFASYFIVFVIRAFAAERLVEFKMYTVRLLICSALIVMQTVCTYFDLKYLVLINIAAVIVTTAIYGKTFYNVAARVLKALKLRKSEAND